MAGLTGRPRLVNIWASWCQPCRDELPWLQQANDSGEVDVLGVDAEDQAKSAGALLADLDVTFPSVYDPANEFAREIRVITKPTTLFVSKEGEVVFVLPGPFASYEEMRELVKTHLKVDLP
jgi:thiol-disulfide isomerase/thioredoxin